MVDVKWGFLLAASLVCVYSEDGSLESMVDEFMTSADERARVHWNRGELREAEQIYLEMVRHAPRHADSHFNVGLVRFSMGDLEGCVQAIEEALRLPNGTPHHTAYHHQLGAALSKMAERTNDHVLWDRGLRHLAKAVRLDPLNVLAWATAATNYMAMGYEAMAVRASRAAARLRPGAEALAALGVNFGRVALHAEAAAAFRRSLALDPNRLRTRFELHHLRLSLADWAGGGGGGGGRVVGWESYGESMEWVQAATARQVAAGEHTYLQPFDALAHPFGSGLLLGVARSYAADAAANTDRARAFRHPPHGGRGGSLRSGSAPTPALAPPLPPGTGGGGGGGGAAAGRRRLRVAYLSADWTDSSAVGRALRGGIARHRRRLVEVTCYTLRNQRLVHETGHRDLVAAVAEHVVTLDQASDYEAAERVNRDGIHILVNLQGYTSSARTEIFAYTPAPLQILLQGFAGTSGAEFLTYNVVDKVQAPPEHAGFYSERLQLLPVSAFRGEGTGGEPRLDAGPGGRAALAAARARAGLAAAHPGGGGPGRCPAEGMVLANLNRPFKIEPRIFDTWLEILNRTAAASAGAGASAGGPPCLWMLRWPEARPAEGNLRQYARGRGGGAGLEGRLVWTELLPFDMRVAGKALADLFLDTPEYNAHGTATEVLSAGTAVLTLPGAKAHSSRVAASVVLGFGAAELVARTHADYADLAVRIATAPGPRRRLQAKIDRLRRGNPIFDRDRWAHDLERSYFEIWDVYSHAPAPMHVL